MIGWEVDTTRFVRMAGWGTARSTTPAPRTARYSTRRTGYATAPTERLSLKKGGYWATVENQPNDATKTRRVGAAVFVGRGRGGGGPGRPSELRLLAFRTAPCRESEGRRSDSPPRNLYFNSTRASVYARNTHTAQRRHEHKPPNDTLLLIFFLAARAVMSSWWRPPLSLQ